VSATDAIGSLIFDTRRYRTVIDSLIAIHELPAVSLGWRVLTAEDPFEDPFDDARPIRLADRGRGFFWHRNTRTL
jgi:hypothetical protein